MPRGLFVGLIAGIVVVIGGLAIAAVALLGRVVAPSDEQTVADETEPTFEAMRLHDLEAARVGLEASDGGITPSALSSAVGEVQSGWDTWQGTPAECMFAGWEPGTSILPVDGTETSADPSWSLKVVSGSQPLWFEREPVAWITSRVFETDADALAFVEGHDARLAACPSFTTGQDGTTATTVLTPKSWESYDATSAGWIATTADWTPTYGSGEAFDVETRVLDVTAGNVVTRVVLFTSGGEGVDEVMDQLGLMIGYNLLEVVR